MYINKKKQWLVYPFLCLLTVFLCWLFTGQNDIFGAQIDWVSQHSVIPDYFRQQFYATGKLLPEFAPNLGGGQNIYNFAYYGLLSPLILPSYLLPFVEMEDYIMAVSIAGIAASICLLYYWLGKHRFSQTICLGVAFMYLFAGPVIYHACHHVMFVSYMPFLYLSLIGIDRYFTKARSGLYLTGVFLMIMTSFYFSIGGMLTLVLYGIYRYLEITPHIRLYRFLKDGIRILFPMLTAICMSGVLLVPTALALFGRKHQTSSVTVSPGKLLLPQFSPARIAYSTYGLGLTTLAITVLIVGLTYRKRSERLLTAGCIVVITIPLFVWLLNGGLYIRDKAVIPFLPLICYLIALYLQKNERHEIPRYINLISAGLTLLLIFGGSFSHVAALTISRQRLLFMADGILMLFSIIVFYRFRKVAILIVPSLICLMLFHGIYSATSDELVSKTEYTKVTDKRISAEINDVLQKDPSFYRIEQMGEKTENAANLNRTWALGQWISSLYSSAYNTEYLDFRTKTFQLDLPYRNNLMQGVAKNPLFQRFMGVKYLIRQKKGGMPFVIKNADTAPIAYATDRILPEEIYNKLRFPYNQTALMNYAVVGNEKNLNVETENLQNEKTKDSVQKEIVQKDDIQKKILETVSRSDFSIPDTKTGQTQIHTDASGTVHVKTESKTTIQVSTPASQEPGKYNLYLQFQVKNLNPDHDMSIWVNDIQNKLSARNHIYYNENTIFTYVMTLSPSQTSVPITFGKGDYDLTDIRCYTGTEQAFTKDMSEFCDLYQSVFRVDRKQTKGNCIAGSINVSKAGYFITSIPYDKNFTAYIDGKQTVIEKVNTAFLGFPITTGNHHIVILYHAPGVKVGKFLSLLGLMMAAVFLISSRLLRKR